jgi:putative colanic acid biosynthesis acetyltransferase WcaF
MGAFACLGPRVNCYCMAKITIGAKAIVSQDAELCAGTHDLSDPELQLIVKPIIIGDAAWVASGALVGPGVTVGRRAVLGARAVTFKAIPESSVYVGNPALFLRQR